MSQDQKSSIEPAHDLLRARHEPLEQFVRPENVVVIGATEKAGSVGRRLAENLLGSSIGYKVFFVNPKQSEIFGRTCYARLADVPATIDLAVIAVPAVAVPGVIEDCVKSGVLGAIIISAGFKEIGAAGQALEAEIRKVVAGTKLRLIGPNCLGVMSPTTGINATFAAAMPRRGNVGFISQSGALLTAILDWSLKENVGFSHVFSVGSMLDVGWGDLIDFLGDDPHTSSILLYMESIGSAQEFLSAAREVALRKPIIVIKAGRTERAAKAAASHTGALAGSDEVLTAAFRRVGVVQVRFLSELFNLAEVLANQPRPKGPNLVIVTNAGGPGVLAADALIEAGGQLANLSAATIEKLNQLLPAHWSHANPVDILGDGDANRFAQSVGIVAGAPECDGVLALLAPQAMADPSETAWRLREYAKLADKPLLASWMGASQVAEGEQILSSLGIPTFAYPDSAVRAFQYMWQYSYVLRALFETPLLNELGHTGAAQQTVQRTLAEVLKTGRTLLTEAESKQVLSDYDIPTVQTVVAATADDAVASARRIGYPVVLKLLSKTITHKTDVGGVRLNIENDQQVVEAFESIVTSVARAAGPGNCDGVTVQPMIPPGGYELIVGSKIDAQFGPVILFGSGGQLVEVYQDRALGLPPLTSTLARRMMERTKVYRALLGIRGREPVDLEALEQVLVRFAQLVVEQPRIAEIDINPLVVSGRKLVALDARIVMHPASCADKDLPRPVIRPYPSQYVSQWKAKDGRTLTIRPIRPEDEPLLARFHETLSEQTVYQRYAQILSLSQRTVHERLARLCFIDYDRQIALVAIDEQRPQPRIVAVARLIKLHSGESAEFAIVLSDAYQHIGLGSELMRRLVTIGSDEKLQRIIGQIHAVNTAMLNICQRLGFELDHSPDGSTRIATLIL